MSETVAVGRLVGVAVAFGRVAVGDGAEVAARLGWYVGVGVLAVAVFVGVEVAVAAMTLMST